MGLTPPSSGDSVAASMVWRDISRGAAVWLPLVLASVAASVAQQTGSSATTATQAPRGTFATDARDTQPLGTIAHQQQEQRSTITPGKHHIITDEDMPSHPAPPPVPEAKTRTTQPKKAKTDPPGDANKPKNDDEELLATIRDQKEKISEMESDLRLKEAELETWRGDDCRQYYSQDGQSPDACQSVLRLMAERDRIQKNLQREQAVLADLQEKARKAGFTSRQYDPD